MTDRVQEEKRDFIRADFFFDAIVRRIDKKELNRNRFLKQMLDSNHSEGSNVPIPDRLPSLDTAFSALGEFLFHINEKLDRIINMLGGDEGAEDRIEVKETLNISGSGVSMVLTQPVKIGQLLDISLNIPVFPMGIFRIQGEVIRITPHEDADAGFFEAGIRFLNITEDERERLIAYTFHQQRRAIRQTRHST